MHGREPIWDLTYVQTPQYSGKYTDFVLHMKWVQCNAEETSHRALAGVSRAKAPAFSGDGGGHVKMCTTCKL